MRIFLRVISPSGIIKTSPWEYNISSTNKLSYLCLFITRSIVENILEEWFNPAVSWRTNHILFLVWKNENIGGKKEKNKSVNLYIKQYPWYLYFPLQYNFQVSFYRGVIDVFEIRKEVGWLIRYIVRKSRYSSAMENIDIEEVDWVLK